MMHGVVINGVDTLQTYGLCLLANVSEGTPPLKKSIVDIPNGDGSLDYSYFTGEPHYAERTVSFDLFLRADDVMLQDLRQRLLRLYHGRICTVVLPTDPAHYYRGTVEFGPLNGYNGGVISVHMLAEPYRLSLTDTSHSITGSGTITITSGSDRKVCPRISTSTEAVLSINGQSVSIAAGDSQIIPAVCLLPHTPTQISVTSSGVTTFVWREAVL